MGAHNADDLDDLGVSLTTLTANKFCDPAPEVDFLKCLKRAVWVVTNPTRSYSHHIATLSWSFHLLVLGLVSSFSRGHSFGLKSDCTNTQKIGSDEKPLWNQNLFEILFQKSQFNQRQQKIRQYRSENISKPSSHTLLQLLVHMQQQLLVLDLKLSSKQHAACRFWVMFQENTINHRFQIWTCWLIYANLMNDLHNAEPPQSFKVCQILVHLNYHFCHSLPAFDRLLCLQDDSVNELTCAIFYWPSFGHIPLLCFLERLLGLTWTEKSGPLSWRPCSHQRKLHYLFQQISTCFKSLKASAPSASVESLASQKRKKLFDLCHMIRCRPFAKWNNKNF